MRLSSLVVVFLLVCGGCQQAPAPKPAAAAPPSEALERKLRLQDRWLAALIEQNELLTAASASPPPGAASPTPPTSAPIVPPPPPVVVTPEPKLDVPILEPNAEGVVDARRRETAPAAANAETASRDIILQVQGLVGGPTPSALINGRIYSVGDSVDSLRLEFVGSSSLLLRGTGFAVRLAPSPMSQRIRVSL